MKQFEYKGGIVRKKCASCKKLFEPNIQNKSHCKDCKELQQKANNNRKNELKEKLTIMPKELTSLQKYQKLCDLRQRQREIKKIASPLQKEYRSISQKMDEYYGA